MNPNSPSIQNNKGVKAFFVTPETTSETSSHQFKKEVTAGWGARSEAQISEKADTLIKEDTVTSSIQ
jgi:hypothetical protein